MPVRVADDIRSAAKLASAVDDGIDAGRPIQTIIDRWIRESRSAGKWLARRKRAVASRHVA